jgi:hypothetical protein
LPLLLQTLVSKVALCEDPAGLSGEQFYTDMEVGDDEDPAEEKKAMDIVKSSLHNLLDMHVLAETRSAGGVKRYKVRSASIVIVCLRLG